MTLFLHFSDDRIVINILPSIHEKEAVSRQPLPTIGTTGSVPDGSRNFKGTAFPAVPSFVSVCNYSLSLPKQYPPPALLFYRLCSASIGFRFAAFTDGRSPNTIPITMEKPTPRKIAGTEIATGVSDMRAMT